MLQFTCSTGFYANCGKPQHLKVNFKCSKIIKMKQGYYRKHNLSTYTLFIYHQHKQFKTCSVQILTLQQDLEHISRHKCVDFKGATPKKCSTWPKRNVFIWMQLLVWSLCMHILKDAYRHFLKGLSYSHPISCLFTSIGSFFYTCFLKICT